MAKEIQNEYSPDYVSPPGETLAEELEERGMSQAELSRRTGRPLKTINEIIQGKAAITAETALQFEQVLGIPASFWNNLESNYRDSLARQQQRHQLEKEAAWLVELPIEDMMRRGCIASSRDKIEQVRQLLRFFAVSSVEQWRLLYEQPTASFRKSEAYKSNPGSVAAWLRWGEIMSQQIECAPYNAKAFQDVLTDARALTNMPFKEAGSKLIKMCADAGVALVFVEELHKTCAWGAARWLSPRKPLIQVSARNRAEDYVWFTFFHEAGHLRLHGKQSMFLDTDEGGSGGGENFDKEAEANKFAADLLINPADWASFIQSGSYNSKAGVEVFASRVGVAPGIVAGRLQHEKRVRHDYYNGFKRPLSWPPEVAEVERAAAAT